MLPSSGHPHIFPKSATDARTQTCTSTSPDRAPIYIYLYLYRRVYIVPSTQSCARKALTATKWDEGLPVTVLLARTVFGECECDGDLVTTPTPPVPSSRGTLHRLFMKGLSWQAARKPPARALPTRAEPGAFYKVSSPQPCFPPPPKTMQSHRRFEFLATFSQAPCGGCQPKHLAAVVETTPVQAI